MSAKCELCEAPPEMDFNYAVLTPEGPCLVNGKICLNCYGEYPSDTAIAVRLLVKRKEAMENAGISIDEMNPTLLNLRQGQRK